MRSADGGRMPVRLGLMLVSVAVPLIFLCLQDLSYREILIVSVGVSFNNFSKKLFLNVVKEINTN